MSVRIIGPGEALILEKISRLARMHHGSVKLQVSVRPRFKSHSIVTFLATWNVTGSVGIVSLTKAELKELTASAGFDKGEHILRATLSKVRR